MITKEGQKNQSLKITLESSDFPTILLLIDPNGNWVKKNFDLRNKKPHFSVIQITLPSDGIYRVIVNGYRKKHRGKYTLSLLESNLPQTAFDNSHNFPDIEGENSSPMEQKAKAERLYKQGLRQYQTRNWKQAIISWKQALGLYQKLENNIKVSFLKEGIKGLEFYLQASNHFERGEFNQALNKYQKISKLLANIQTQIERNGTVIGISSRDLALAIAGNNIDIGSVYLAQSENTKAEEQFKQGLEVSQRINYPLGQAFAYNSLGQISFAKSEYITALNFYEQALQNAQGNYLIEKHTIVTAPSIQVLDATRQIKQKRQPFNQSPLKPQDALIIGNPNPMPEGFFLLDNAEKEAIEIASLLNTKAFIGSEATETAMVKQMSQARLIHLATHGTFEDTQGK